MIFSERFQLAPQRQIQINDVDLKLRNRIINFFSGISDSEVDFVLDKLGQSLKVSKSISLNSLGISNLNRIELMNYLSNCTWYELYDALETVCLFYKTKCKTCDEQGICEGDCKWYFNRGIMQKQINEVLEQEKSGYRIINGEIASITSEIEINSLEESTQTQFDSVSVHMTKALKLYSDRDNSDYENSIKESISAVEAMCCIITGSNNTLGDALKKLELNGIRIHGSLKAGFDKLYGYTSDESGIRHGKIDFNNASAEDAKYMLVSCSAFINYLKEKYTQLEG